MWSFIEINDTLQITTEQWLPKMLDYKKHKEKPFLAEDFAEQVFEFYDKPKIRIFKIPPVRNFLVQNINGKRLYRWLIHIIKTTHDTIKETTSGEFKIIYIYSPEEMQYAHKLIDRNKDTDYLWVM